jgi:cytochrome c-type biogenesis protein CcmE
MNTYMKFTLAVVAILGTLVWLAVGGINESKTYYKTVAELDEMGLDAMGERLRVAGNVAEGSIVRDGREVHFVLSQENQQLSVVYDGMDPLPDTFRDGSEALADGELGADGVFRASKIQAKCASKYEAEPGAGYESSAVPAT